MMNLLFPENLSAACLYQQLAHRYHEGYGLQPVHKVNQINGALAPEGKALVLQRLSAV
jgi:hypothetical protein